jgi:hypothetical protein
MPGDASSVVEMKEMNQSLKVLNLTPSISSHTSPSSKESSIRYRREWKRGMDAFGCVCLELG